MAQITESGQINKLHNILKDGNKNKKEVRCYLHMNISITFHSLNHSIAEL